MAALGGVGSGAAAASGSAKAAPAASTVDALSMSRLERLLSRMFGPAACGLDATARLTASAALGIRRNAARHGEYRTRYHTPSPRCRPKADRADGAGRSSASPPPPTPTRIAIHSWWVSC